MAWSASAAHAAGAAFADDPAYNGPAVKSVTATLVDTTGAAIGTVQLHQDVQGTVLVRIDAAGLPAGAHGWHVHAVGKCEGPAFASAGAHFNATTRKHGLLAPEGPHAGDLEQIPVTFTGTGTHTATNARILLTAGASSIEDADGSALIVHAGADDQVTDPTGNSGARIACAVLAQAQPATPVATTTTAAPKPPATGSGLDGGPGVNALVLALIGGLVATLGGAAVALRRRAIADSRLAIGDVFTAGAAGPLARRLAVGHSPLSCGNGGGVRVGAVATGARGSRVTPRMPVPGNRAPEQARQMERDPGPRPPVGSPTDREGSRRGA